jgi:hypothetical protein
VSGVLGVHLPSGMLPMLFLTMRTPMNAGDWPTVPMLHVCSAMIFQISFAF